MFFRNKSSGVSWLVVFLGNPGDKYAKTRHNVGFMTADVMEKRLNTKLSRIRFNALTAIADFQGEKLLLLKPQTYMNLSGNAVAPAAAYYKLPVDHLIVVCDDVDLPLGKLRIKTKGSSGGHKGLKSIISVLGTEEFLRIKIGVGAPVRENAENPMVDWVLGEFKGKDAQVIAETCDRAADAVCCIIDEGSARAMNQYN